MMLLRFILGMAVFLPLERIAPHRRGEQILRLGWATDVLNYLGNGLLAVAILGWWSTLVPDALAWARPYVLPINWRDQPGIVQVVVVLAVGSLTYYWGHRLQHTWTPLWRFHAVHHS